MKGTYPTGTQQPGGAGAGAGGGGSEEKETKAPEKTAASAVQQLAADDPSGRHICYRVYAAGEGWTDAVCDGEIAGTEDSGTPLKAVNIAVSGTKGTSGGPYVPDQEDGCARENLRHSTPCVVCTA